MNAIEFAKHWAGHRFRLPEDCAPPSSVSNSYFAPRGKLVGYVTGDSERVILEFSEDFTQYCWPLHSGITLTIDEEDMYNASYPMVLAVKYTKLTVPKSRKELEDELKKKDQLKKAAKTTKIVPYPQVCSVCNSPARVYNKHTMCSNRSCKTRTDIFKSANYKPVKRPKMTPIICTRTGCGSKGVYASPNENGTYYIEFECGHDTVIPSEQIAPNTILHCTIYGYETDRMWNGKSWENI